MREAPVLGYRGGTGGYAATRPPAGTKLDSRAARVRSYVSYLRGRHADALTAADIDARPLNTFTYAANGFSAMMTSSQAMRLRHQKGVVSVQRDVLHRPQTDVSPEFLGLGGAGEAWATGRTGEGVVVGVIDTGIWPEHPSFADPGGLPRPRGAAAAVPCGFGDAGYNPDDKRFRCQNKLIGARDMRATYKAEIGAEVYNSARDYIGHGTHTAATAAGNDGVHAEIFGIDRGTVSGIAPRASVIAYSALGSLGGFGSDLAAAIDRAIADGVDVINYSIGSGTPSLTGPDDIAFLFAVQAGVHVAVSNGNAGPAPRTIGSPASVPWVTAVGASTHTRTFEATATLGNRTRYTGASVTTALPRTRLVDAADLRNEFCDPQITFRPAPTGQAVLCARGADVPRANKSLAVLEQGGVGMILFNESPTQDLLTDNHWVPSVHVSHAHGLAIRTYIDRASRVGTRGATVSLTQGRKTPTQGLVMADFSSRGPVGLPAAPDIIRPDLTAPGVNILAGNSPTPDLGRPGELFQSMSGTSMSSPEVAGLMALIDQDHPKWSPAAVRSALMTSARQNVTEAGGQRADPFDMGAGHVDPGRPGEPGSMFDPGLVYDARIDDYVAFLCGATEGLVNPATCDTLAAAGFSFDAAQLNMPSIGDSSVVATSEIGRTITNVSGKRLDLTARVTAPAGFTVRVTPAKVSLAPGARRDITVTISNQSSPKGRWAFGSLTWTGEGYTAYSPIAVRAAALGVPEEISVSGASGTGQFAVAFGYDGAYTVDSYGVAAEKLTTGTVAQDPDQVFDPSDEENGATRHELDLTDVKLFRFEMNQEDVTGTSTDLDIYVLDPNGDVAAVSGAAGTNEIIELVDPAPGTYQLYVHGWGVGSTPANYTFHSWTILDRPNAGTLQVVDAPARAVTGETGRVRFSWSGVEAGRTAFGLFAHGNGARQLAVTKIRVDS